MQLSKTDKIPAVLPSYNGHFLKSDRICGPESSLLANMDSISETVVCIGEKSRFCEEGVAKKEKPTAPTDGTENDSTIANTSQPKLKTVRFCTPLGETISLTDRVKQVNSLETFYAALKDRVVDYLATNAAGHDPSAEMAAIDVNASNSEVWVARYVHYTSKYGLGFLFNTGSAGVYFNDSTKIVLSADGKVFQYTEKHPHDSFEGYKVVHQKHLISAYP
mmetsp:Transcript_41280/g.71522  ORF Transcript_41280/g.71522 Transcript_41280/m.71522 type:complete len:220 (-) Transcript_41280:109-768(-)